nr:hypothetical protein COLO4_27339 [Ipomoea batatas]GME03822.1 hypothetical protein COLO4_27339 [Ipomoea batatas]
MYFLGAFQVTFCVSWAKEGIALIMSIACVFPETNMATAAATSEGLNSKKSMPAFRSSNQTTIQGKRTLQRQNGLQHNDHGERKERQHRPLIVLKIRCIDLEITCSEGIYWLSLPTIKQKLSSLKIGKSINGSDPPLPKIKPSPPSD